jgi:alpha-galactosidase
MPLPHRRRFARIAVVSRLAVLAAVIAAVMHALPASAETTELARAGDAFILQENGRRVWAVGNDKVTFTLGLSGNGALTTLGLDRTGMPGLWRPGGAPDFTVLVGHRRLTPGQSTFTFREIRTSASDDTVRLELVFEDTSSKIRVTRNYACTAGSGAVEVWSVFEAISGASDVTIGDIGAWRLAMPVGAVNWVTGLRAGEEQGGRFTRRQQGLSPDAPFELGSDTRSTESAVPVVWFSGEAGSFFGGVNWSGAWRLQAAGPGDDGRAVIQFWLGDSTATLSGDAPLEGPHGFFGVAGAGQSDVTLALQAYFRQGVRHGRPLAAPVTYNSWFAWGTHIDEDILRNEMEKAARVGAELFVIDAGWYAGSGDVWDFSTGLGNWVPDPERFPSGLGPLTDYAHELGMKAGLWVEPERLDLAAVYDLELGSERMLATRDGRYHPGLDNGEATTGQICLGDAEGREWVLAQLVRLIETARPDYLKWDNNFWINCDRPEHGHGTAGGNFAHVKGLYAVLAALRERFPELTIENCAGGGNRLDPGLLQYTDSAWMDDVTTPSARVRHNFEGLATIYPPAYLLSFVMSGEFETIHESAGRSLEFASRMPGMLGLTWRGSEFDDDEFEDIGREISVAKAVRAVVPGAAAFMLTDQVRDDGAPEGDAIQLYSPPTGISAVFVYATDSLDMVTIRLKGLDPEMRYVIMSMRGDELAESTGAGLMTAGVDVVNSSDAGSQLFLVVPRPPEAPPEQTVRR